MTRLLLTDLDDTLLGNDEATEALGRYLASRPEVRIGYATGRDFGRVQPVLTEYPFLKPVAVICDVGTELRLSPQWQVDAGYRRCMEIAFDPTPGRERLAGFPGLLPQDLPVGSLRTSYYFNPVEPPDAERLQQVLGELASLYAIRLSRGHALDLLPLGGGKGTAARYLAERLGLGRDSILVAGDSGNDLDLLESGFPAVLVGNAGPEMQGRPLPGVFRARGRNAWGILEALERIGW